MKQLTNNDIMSGVRNEVFVQDYSKKSGIEGIKIIEVKRFSGEDGTFEDLVRIKEDGCLELFPDFKLAQINRSKILVGTIKGWHIHYNQEDIWYVAPEDHMILGLWDLRGASSTKDQKMKVVMGAGVSKLVYIPRGIAHGVVNVNNKPGSIIYFVNQHYNINDPDEHRLPWDKAGAEFWQPTRE